MSNSENWDKQVGANYYCFVSSDGEIFGGGGRFPRDALIKQICDSLEGAFKGLTDENPHRKIVLTIDTEPIEDEKWTEYKFLDTKRNSVLEFFASVFYRIGYWFSEKERHEKRIVKIVKLEEDS